MRLFKDVLVVNTTQHHVVDARRAMFSSCSWHKKPTLVELEMESSTVYCGENFQQDFDFEGWVSVYSHSVVEIHAHTNGCGH